MPEQIPTRAQISLDLRPFRPMALVTVTCLRPLPSSALALFWVIYTFSLSCTYNMSADDDSSGWQLTESDPGVFT